MRIPHISHIQSLLVTVLLIGTCSAADSNQVVIRHFDDGNEQCFALAVRAATPVSPSIRRHIIVVDTSASQIGKVRESSLKLVTQVLANLPTTDFVQIYAVDVECDPLTQNFVPTASEEVNAAVRALSRRTPLGTTSLRKALVQIGKTASKESPTSVLMIGDGLTSADRIKGDDLIPLCDDLVNNAVSIHSLVLGPHGSVELPGILANATGGTVATVASGKEEVSASAAAQSLRIAPGKVAAFNIDGDELQVANRGVLMIRPDRHSILFGQGTIPQFKLLTAALAGGKTMNWLNSATDRQSAGAEISHFLQRAKSSNGIDCSVASLEQLKDAGKELQAAFEKTIAAGELLRRKGRHREARSLMQKAAMMNPADVRPRQYLTRFPQDEPQTDDQANPPLPGSVNTEQELPATTVTPAPEDPQSQTIDGFDNAPVKNDPLSDVESELKLKTQILVAETNAAVKEARSVAFDNPDYATSLLKDVLETIRASADISPDDRAELQRRVIGALSAVTNQQDVNRITRKQIAKDQAVQEAQRKLLSELDLEEKRLAILIDQVRGLLDRARHGDRNGFEDAESVSRTAIDLKPGNGPATQALFMSEAAGQNDKMYRLINLRHDRFLETLYQVELSHVPFPDEPPIQFPPADVWRALTLTRKPRYESFDLRSEAPVEKWLRQMLDKPVPLLDYPGEAPLSEILEQISTYYTTTWGQDGGASGTDFRMTIWPDKAELDLEGISTLEDVVVSDISFEGITLRNALKLIFDQTTEPELTYVIENEVFKVTTVAKAESDDNLVTRVYPVADLVIPPIQLGGGGQGGGGFGGGGQQGGFGGGGQQGGFGGGGQQGGFGGGGGAGFSVPPEALKAWGELDQGGFSNDAVNSLKKKSAR